MMKENLQAIADWRTEQSRLSSSCRRLAISRLPVNLYSAHALMQRRAATLLHGIVNGSGSWEELDGGQLADDVRGDRMSLLLGGVTGGVAHTPAIGRGLLTTASTGTLFLTSIEKLAPNARHVLCRIIETGRYTPLGDPYPRPISCRIIVATHQPLYVLARRFAIEWSLAETLGHIALRAESVISALEVEELLHTHHGSLAAAS